ncbi:MAG TPA: hypothetical protein VGX97_04075, partial [bacterium]|nr:hypothetical protein [bacterium]
LTFWALLIVAVLGLSQLLAAWRLWRASPTLDHVAAVLVLGVGLLAVMGWLAFLLYEVDRAAGRIRHQVGVYEWLIAMRRREAHSWLAPQDQLGPEGLGSAGISRSARRLRGEQRRHQRRRPRTRDAQTGPAAPRQTGGTGA